MSRKKKKVRACFLTLAPSRVCSEVGRTLWNTSYHYASTTFPGANQSRKGRSSRPMGCLQCKLPSAFAQPSSETVPASISHSDPIYWPASPNREMAGAGVYYGELHIRTEGKNKKKTKERDATHWQGSREVRFRYFGLGRLRVIIIHPPLAVKEARGHLPSAGPVRFPAQLHQTRSER
jgi:hypothetical protein